MKIIQTGIDGLLVVEPDIFEDPRGYFFESFHREKLSQLGLAADFVQDNESLSQKGVLRGLHFQRPPFAQGKLVRVVKGSVLDVALDIRKGSPSYGKSASRILSESNKLMMWIPVGFAHGFLTLEDNTIFQYKCTGYYNRSSEAAIRWNDPDLAIDWGIDQPSLSEKDRNAPFFKDLQSPFKLI
jgi:dTDP-4-dehydrorhamnose 3,5-epimerase